VSEPTKLRVKRYEMAIRAAFAHGRAYSQDQLMRLAKGAREDEVGPPAHESTGSRLYEVLVRTYWQQAGWDDRPPAERKE
jgi:hypothetical protein